METLYVKVKALGTDSTDIFSTFSSLLELYNLWLHHSDGRQNYDKYINILNNLLQCENLLLGYSFASPSTLWHGWTGFQVVGMKAIFKKNKLQNLEIKKKQLKPYDSLEVSLRNV